jgi:hypothetical protein
MSGLRGQDSGVIRTQYSAKEKASPDDIEPTMSTPPADDFLPSETPFYTPFVSPPLPATPGNTSPPTDAGDTAEDGLCGAPTLTRTDSASSIVTECGSPIRSST